MTEPTGNSPKDRHMPQGECRDLYRSQERVV
jgi:hypothetical protein